MPLAIKHVDKQCFLKLALIHFIMRGAKLNYLLRIGASCALLALVPSQAQAAPATGDAQIAVVTPLSFIQVENLDFGRIIPSGTAGTVTLSTANIRTATGGVTLVGTDYQNAKFAGQGTILQRVRINITPNTITLTGPGAPMTVTNVTIGTDGTLLQLGASPNYLILSPTGIFWFNVGGRLNVGANQAAGYYSGTFTATLVYQ
jgi:hypothetical protein